MKSFSLALASFTWLCASTVCAQTTWLQSFTRGTADDLPVDERLAPFYHGVASGDPSPDGVVIWTRVTPETDATIPVDWTVATDTGLANVVASGSTTTDSVADYTVKVEVGGLEDGDTYYYRFEALGETSLTGRTRTAGQDLEQLKFAVVSCNNYQQGYFNAFARIAGRNDLDAVIHLGDFIYEYERDENEENRGLEPEHEILSLDDYRLRYNWYRLDPDLRRAMQQHPFIFIWDDHETANNSWTGGAENHDPGEGDWGERKLRATRAYFEWVPIRDEGDFDIRRRIAYGDLAEFHMVDTRLEGREEQLTDADDPDLWLPDRTILGPVQFEWFTEGLKQSTARWKVVANQVVFAPLLLDDFDAVYPGAADEFLDVWNGYPAEREKVLDTLLTHGIDDVVWITGDVHIALAQDLPRWDGDSLFYDPVSAAGSACVEFVTTSISSNNFDERLGSVFLSGLVEDLLAETNPHNRFGELDRHGYLILDLTEDRAQADFWFVDTKNERTEVEAFEAGWYAESGSNHLAKASGPSPPKPEQDVPAPDPTATGLPQTPAGPVLWSVHPNPATDRFTVGFSLAKPAGVELRLLDGQGRLLASWPQGGLAPGHYRFEVDGLRTPGTAVHFLELKAGAASRVQKLILGR